jgi:hypothetical protein
LRLSPGPPGTGKSTFNAEFVQRRVIPDVRTIIATSSNKAIDSQSEKLLNKVKKNIVAFGNRSRLGPTSQKLLLESQVDLNASVRGWGIIESHVDGMLQSANNSLAQINTKEYHSQLITATVRKQLVKKTEGALQQVKQQVDDLRANLKAFQRVSHSVAVKRLIPIVVKGTSSAGLFSALLNMTDWSVTRNPDFGTIRDTVARVSGETKDFGRKLRAVVSLQILKEARYFVSTAATAAKLPDRIRRCVETLIGDIEIDNLSLEFASMSFSSRPTGSMTKANKDSILERATADVLKNCDLCNFPCVILDEAGAMLQPGNFSV